MFHNVACNEGYTEMMGLDCSSEALLANSSSLRELPVRCWLSLLSRRFDSWLTLSAGASSLRGWAAACPAMVRDRAAQLLPAFNALMVIVLTLQRDSHQLFYLKQVCGIQRFLETFKACFLLLWRESVYKWKYYLDRVMMRKGYIMIQGLIKKHRNRCNEAPQINRFSSVCEYCLFWCFLAKKKKKNPHWIK